MSGVTSQRGGALLQRQTNRGSVMVELSLVGTMFFILLIGIADVGQVLFVQQAMAERVRSAARWGAVNDPTNASAIRNMVLYFQPTVPAGGKASFGLTSSMVNVSTADAGTDDYRLVVQISGYSLLMLSPYIAGSYKGPPINVSVPLGLYH
jgi:Flp pilus assembly protein TadG